MRTFQATIKEKGNNTLLHPSYTGDVDEKFLIDFWGLDKPDVEWYSLVEVPESNERVCCICGKPIQGYGNNAHPVKEGICCNSCNASIVLPERIKSTLIDPKK